MKAIRVKEFGPPEVMKLEKVADPTPGANQVVIKVRAIGVNPVEAYIRAGIYPTKPPLPYTPGSDVAGEIKSVGKGVTQFKKGDRVYTSGTISGAYAELALCDVNQVFLLPKNVSFEQGAALGVPYGTAYRGIFERGKGRAGETILIHGATGGVGTAAVQFAVALGMVIIGTGGSADGLKLIKKLGAAYALNHKSRDYLDEIKKITDGRGVDMILEFAAHINLDKDFSVLRNNGRLVVIGSRGKIEIDPRNIISANAHVIGSPGGAAGILAEANAAIGAGLRSGTLKPVIGKKIPLAEAVRAHQEIMEHSAAGKMVLIP
jgi:NADPH2:quinone reductase